LIQGEKKEKNHGGKVSFKELDYIRERTKGQNRGKQQKKREGGINKKKKGVWGRIQRYLIHTKKSRRDGFEETDKGECIKGKKSVKGSRKRRRRSESKRRGGTNGGTISGSIFNQVITKKVGVYLWKIMAKLGLIEAGGVRKSTLEQKPYGWKKTASVERVKHQKKKKKGGKKLLKKKEIDTAWGEVEEETRKKVREGGGGSREGKSN